MKRLTLAFLTVLVLVLTFTPVMSANAEVQLPAHIKFKCHALGSCVVFYGFARGWGQDPPLWLGSASGSIMLNGHAKATSYEEIPPEGEMQSNMYGMAYFTAPGGVKAGGFLTLKWFENDELHQLWIAIYSKPTTQGVFQPETDKFLAGFMGWTAPSGWEKLQLSYSGIYKIGSNVQYLSGPIGVLASRIEILPYAGIEYIALSLWFGKPQYILTAYWWSETVNFPVSPPITIPAATILVRDVKLL